MADALSRKNYCSNLIVRAEQLELCRELEKLRLEIVEHGQLHELTVKYDLEDRIRAAQKKCPEIHGVKALLRQAKATDFRVDEQGTSWLKERICIPKDEQICTEIL